MIPNTNYNISSVQISALPIKVRQIEGYHKGSSAAWLQVFDSCIAPAAGAVPIYQLPLNATAQFAETLQVDDVHFYEGVFVGISSTEGTWTASANTMDLIIFTDTTPLATNAVGDKTTAVNTLQVWSQATGAASAKKLYQLIVKELLGQTQYIYIASTDSLTSQPNFLAVLPANSVVKYLFGDGLRPFSKVLPSTTNQGCTVWVSTASGVGLGVAPTVSANAANILAITN